MCRFIGNKLIAALALLGTGIAARAQNLVLNPSFESVNTGSLQCSWYTTQAQFNSAVNNWTCPTGGSTDVFHTSLGTGCFCAPMSTNGSRVGQQMPRTGNSHTAIFVYGNGGCSPYREYVQGRLSTPLTVGQTYVVEMYVSLGDESDRGAGNIGVKFTTGPVNNSSMCVYAATPEVNYTGPVITDKTGWTLISFCYTPTTAGLQYLMIGNFSNDAATPTAPATPGTVSQVRYFLDDVRVEAVTGTPVSAGTNGTLNICAGQPAANLFDYLGGTPATTGTWTGPSALTGGYLGTFNPDVNVAGVYRYTVGGSGACGSTPAFAEVTVSFSGTSNATITQPAGICTTAPAVQLTAAGTGGTWSASCGTCISAGGLFNPATAGAGNHTVTYTIGGACPGTDSKTVNVYAQPNVTVTPNTVVCAGSQAPLVASGAATYTWAPATDLSISTGATTVATPVSTITYTVTGTDANGCQNQASVTVTVNPLPTVSAGNDVALCAGASAPLTATGADTYTWSPAANLSSATGATVTATPPATVTYTVTGTDVSGCQNTDAVTVTVNPLPTVDAGADVVVCAGASTVLTGSGAATYVWAPATNLSSTTTASVTSTPTATLTYTLTGTDANGCQNTDAVTVTLNPLPTVSVSNDAVICLGQNVPLIASGAASYTWSPGTGLSITTGATTIATPAATITYTVTGTDANGCQNTDDVLITVNPLPAVSAGNDVTICAGTPTRLTATGAASYSWSPAAGLSSATVADPLATPPATATYTVTGTDGNGCQNTDAVTVTVNPLPTVDAGADVTMCAGASTVLTGAGATTYVWSPATNLSSTTAATVTSTATVTVTYTLTGTDANGCQNTDAVTVTVNALPPVNAGTDVALCTGGSTVLTATGAGTYVWSPATDLSGTTTASVTSTPAATITYTVTGTDGNGCQNTDAVTVTVNPQAPVNAGADVAFCAGGSVSLNATGAATYVWSPTTGLSSGTGATVTASPGSTVIYTVTGTDANGCSGSDQVEVTVHPDPQVNFNGGPLVGCVPLTTNFNYLGDPAVTFVWNFGNGSQGAGTAPTATYTQTGTFSVGLTVTDAFGCTSSRTIQNLVVVHGYPQAGMGVNPQEIWQDDAWTHVTDGSTGAGSWHYSISDGERYDVPSFTHRFADTGVYQIVQIVISDAGCADTAMAQVHVKPVSTVFIPNAFTPGNDPINNSFKVYGNLLGDVELSVFNRWGERIFFSMDQNEGWDGTYGGTRCKQDVYVYMLRYRDHRKEEKKLVGSVTLLR